MIMLGNILIGICLIGIGVCLTKIVEGYVDSLRNYINKEMPEEGVTICEIDGHEFVVIRK